MKLQKLVYYSQVRHLVSFGEPLFENRIEAWTNGPVVPDLFRMHVGRYMVGVDNLDTPCFSRNLSVPECMDINKVVNLLGSCSGEQLRELTHSEAPWINARQGLAPDQKCSEEITVGTLLDFYTSPLCDNPVVQ